MYKRQELVQARRVVELRLAMVRVVVASAVGLSLIHISTLPEPLQPSPEQQSVIVETLHEIDALLDTLRPRVKQAFLMATLDGIDVYKRQRLNHASNRRSFNSDFDQTRLVVSYPLSW